MSIKQKALSICVGVSIFCIALLIIVTKVFVVDNLLILEQTSLERDMIRTIGIISHELSRLENFATDWSAWDETYQFIQNENDEYLTNNLVDLTFTSQQINLIAYYNQDGKMVFSKEYDLNSKCEVKPSFALMNSLQKHKLLHHDTIHDVTKGIIETPRGFMLIVSKPITDSLQQLPIKGALIVGRYLDREEVERLSAIAGFQLSFIKIEDDSVGREIDIIDERDRKISFRAHINSDNITGSVLLQDVFGKAKLALNLQEPRVYYRQGIRILSIYVTILCIAAVLFGMVIYILVARRILDRLVLLTDEIGKIKRLDDVSDRLGTEGDDEITSLANIVRKVFFDLKASHAQLHYLSIHDSLTGVYNRTYFDDYLQHVSANGLVGLGFIVCDVDGLKLANDMAGHNYGDDLLKVLTEILQVSCPDGMIFRIGGDEFVIAVQSVDEKRLRTICRQIHKNIGEHDAQRTDVIVPLNVSVGYSLYSDVQQDVKEIVKLADNMMYREKLLHNQSRRSGLVQTLRSALEARDFITEGHAQRLREMVLCLAQRSNISEEKFSDLQLFAEFHDVGKIGIPDSILFKTGPLTVEERTFMKKHCEIGFRIAQSTIDLAPIADLILKHHEWWNGEGYPLGLCAVQIPIECRILAVVDAFDAMTSDRPYRKALSKEVALQELQLYAGTQFDPVLTKAFIEMMTE